MALKNSLTNAAIYIDGNNYIGQAKTAKLPKIKQKMFTSAGLGSGGETKLPTGVIEAMEASFEMSSWYPSAMINALDPFTARRVQVRASLDSYMNGSRVSQAGLVVELTGVFEEVPLGDLKFGDGVEQELKMAVHYVKVTLNGVLILEIDPDANIYRVGDKDLAAIVNLFFGI